jgi:PAS domain S-box-containing protein
MSVVTQFPAAFDPDRDLRFRAMFEGVAIGIGICGLDGGILEANPALGRMLGYSQRELAGTHAGELFPELHRGLSPSNSAPEQRLLGELMRGERDSIEIEKRWRRRDGSELWGDLTVSLGRGPRRQPAFLIAVLTDATERKRVEEQLHQAEKMEVIGRLAGGIAHDFNNLLTGILLYCDLLSAGLASAELAGDELSGAELASAGLAKPRLAIPGLQWNGLRQQVGEVRLASEQGAALTQQLLAIARKQAAEPRAIRINEIVASSKNLLQRLVGEQIELVVVLDPVLDSVLDSGLDSGAGLVLADPAQLRQILLNLVLNARDAMPQGGTIRLSTSAAKLPSEVFSKTAPGSARRAVSLVVSDNGCGMDGETRARLFEPFFTTKLPGRGTGLGLATVQRIVTESGGTIEVESEPGRGTSIAVFFPAIECASLGAEGDGASPVSTDRS